MEKTKNQTQTPNDQRSVVKNKNNPAYPKDKANTAKQIKENKGKKK